MALLVLSLSGCAGRHTGLAGDSGPVRWQVTDVRFVERVIEGTPRDLYTFTLVLDETQGQDVTFTQVVSVLTHPYLPTTPQEVAVQWQLRPRGTLRQPFFFPWCSTAACKHAAALAPLKYTMALLGTDARGRPVRVTIRTTLPETRTVASPATPAPPATPSGPVAFDTVQGHILVRALLNQQEHVTLVLDTGASATSLTPDVARKLGLSPTAQTPTRTTAVVGGQRLEVPVVTLASLTVGAMRRDNLAIGILASFPNAPLIDGILGADFLQPFTMTFDYARSQLWLLPAGSQPQAAAASPVPLRLVNHLLLVPVRFNQQDTVWLLLDTGASRTIITPATAQKLGLQPAANVSKQVMQRGDGALHEVPLVQCPTFQLGETVVESVLVGIAEVLPQAPVVGGLLGMDVLARFTVTLDRQTPQLWLAPPSARTP